MATYLELYTLRGNPELRQKIAVALTIAADTIRSETSSTNGHAERIVWAGRILNGLDGEAEKALRMVLAANKGANVSQIKNASDTAIQAKVDTIVNILAGVPNV